MFARVQWTAVRSVFLLTVVWMMAVLPATADELRVPDAAMIQTAIEHYVDESKQAPGVVVGIIHRDQRQLFSYGDSGGASLELNGDSLFEIGSISKVFTGLLLADMVLRGEVRYDDTIAERAPSQFEFAERVGGITLEQLATHTSGLPRLAINFGPLMRGLFSSDPYAGSTAEEIYRSVAGLMDEQMGTQGEFAYSNLGYGLLGQLLAEAAGQSYQELLQSRVLDPMGVSGIVFGPDDAEEDFLVQGFHRGRAASHWNLDAYAPAGGLVASTNQMLDFIEANLKPQQPFITEAQQTRGHSDGEYSRPLGLGYSHRLMGDRTWLWHNGGTGGFRSYFGFAPDMDFGIVILTNGTGNSDALAASLIQSSNEPMQAYQRSWFGLLMAFMGVLIAPLTLLATVFAKPKPVKPGKRMPDRLDLIVLIAGVGMMLVVSRMAGDWISVPFSFWWLGLVVSLAAAVALLRAHFMQRSGLSGGTWSLLGRGLIVLLYSLIIVAFI